MKYIVLIFVLSVFSSANECTYPYKFKFDKNVFYPTFMTVTRINTELLLKSVHDEYLTIMEHLPAIYIVRDQEKNLKKILSNKNLISHKFIKEIHKRKILLKIYNNDSETLIFIVDKKSDDCIGTLSFSNSTQYTINSIIESLAQYKKACTEKQYWNIYTKKREIDLNAKLELLYSIWILNPSKKVKSEIIKVLKDKQKLIDTAIMNLIEEKSVR